MIGGYGLTLVQGPQALAVSVEEAKNFLRVEHDAEDGDIEELVEAAIELVQHESGRQLVQATLRLTMPHFPPWELELPRTPLVSVETVEYMDAEASLVTLDPVTYVVVADHQTGWIQPVYGGSWPAAYTHPQAVRVTFVAGYGAAADVPRRARQAVLMAVGSWYENRGEAPTVLPEAVTRLIGSVWDGSYRG